MVLRTGPIALNGANLKSELTKHVKEYPFYHNRLRPIDHTTIIRQYEQSNEPWEDIYFPAEKSSLLDKTMSHDLRKKWNTYVWKRPQDVYGEGEFSLFD